jgi:glycosyltransferase involved in cell wall biosynthesis
MKILSLSENFPLWDRASGDLRYWHFLRALSGDHELWLCPYYAADEAATIGIEESKRYRRDTEALGVRVWDQGVLPLLRRQTFDAVIFEFYIAAQEWLDAVRFYQPQAIAVVDSVDLHFRRLASKAAVTQSVQDAAELAVTKQRELDAYRRADVIITVTEEDRACLAAELPHTRTFTIPNIHTMPKIDDATTAVSDSILFIGSFLHAPNEDAVLYFVREIFPHVLSARPNAQLSIVGNAPTEAIRQLASNRIEVLGFVPSTAPYLCAAKVSVAPLRFGAGIKGKIGEAMSFGVPVVTTSVGGDGFGFVPGVHALVNDDPREFANSVIRLLEDDPHAQTIGAAGRHFIEQHYSEAAVGQLIDGFVESLRDCHPKRLPLLRRVERWMTDWYDRSLAWRFRHV